MYIKCKEYAEGLKECELIADDNEIYEEFIDEVIEESSIPDYFYGIDDFTGEDIELKTENIIPKGFIEWFKKEIEPNDELEELDKDMLLSKLKEFV